MVTIIITLCDNITGKKVKRTGEASLYHETSGKLTDEAFAVCKVSGVDPRELYPR